MYKVGDIITDEQYTDASNYCAAHPEKKLKIDDLGDGKNIISKIPDPTKEENIQEKNKIIKRLLESTDKYMISDFPITEEDKQKYIEYRKYLRDLSKNKKFPNVDVLSFEDWNNKNSNL